MEFAELAREQRLVLFLNHMFPDLFFGGMCLALPAIPYYGQLRFKATKDTSLKPSLYVLPISTHSEKGPLLKLILSRFLEHSLFSDPESISELKSFTSKSLPDKPPLDDKYFECLEYEKFPVKSPKISPLDLANFRTLLYIYGALLFIALIVLIVERTHASRIRTKVRPRGQRAYISNSSWLTFVSATKTLLSQLKFGASKLEVDVS